MSIELIKQLRDETGVSLNECKKAIQEADGDLEKAKDILKKKGQDIAAKKAGREAGEGRISSYIHDNQKVGVLLDLRCESDFVAKSDDFKNLSKEITLQIAAMGPQFVKEEDISQQDLEKERDFHFQKAIEDGKPEEVAKKISDGKVQSFAKDYCLLLQPWIKDNKKTIEELIQEYVAKIGENIVVARFTRYEL